VANKAKPIANPTRASKPLSDTRKQRPSLIRRQVRPDHRQIAPKRKSVEMLEQASRRKQTQQLTTLWDHVLYSKPHTTRVALSGDQVGLANELRDDVETLARRAADRRARQYVHHSPARRGCSGAVGAGNGRTILFRRGLPVELGRTSCSRWSAYRRDRRWLCPRAAQARTV
jgi:hypothetical protein